MFNQAPGGQDGAAYRRRSNVFGPIFLIVNEYIRLTRFEKSPVA